MNVYSSLSFLCPTAALIPFSFRYLFLRLKAPAKRVSMSEYIGKSKTGQTCMSLAPSALPVYSCFQIRMWFLRL